MSKPPQPTFAAYLASRIAADYDSDSAFARAIAVSYSAVSRWLSGTARPSVRLIERIAKELGDDPQQLVALAHPELGGTSVTEWVAPERHPLTRELDRLLAADGPVPAAERETLATLVDSVIDRYRRYLRKRRSG